MKKIISLNGEYRLYTYDSETAPELPTELSGEYITANVPGNVELDYMTAGLLPDLYAEDNVKLAGKLENKDFWFVREFDVKKSDDEKATLVFEGVDCIAEYFVNGKKAGESDNALIPFSFDVSALVVSGKNTLAVHIRSAFEYAKKYSVQPYNVAFPDCYESLNIRKSAASFGWDILPRALSAGLWRGVSLELSDGGEITDLYISTCRADSDVAVLIVTVNADLPSGMIGRCSLKITGKCGDDGFVKEAPFLFNAATVYPYVYNPKLWYPAGAGKPELYDVTAEILCDGKVVAEKRLRYGIRRIEVKYTEAVGENGNFEFIVNGKPCRIRGIDHTPIDVFHSKDEAKTAAVIADVKALNCNLVRVWGGGVYESDSFYDLCDENGIMVWQDIMLACHAYPQTDEFQRKISAECEAIAKRIANHPSLALWCGSNETDWAYVCVGLDPNDDEVTRSAIKKALYKCDPYRAYLPSTPYFSREYIKRAGGVFYLDLDEIERARTILPEEHYWWHRNDFLSFIRQSHRFVAEIGYSGCPERSSLVRFLPEKFRFSDDVAWRCHSFPTENGRDTGIKYLFEAVPDSDAEMIKASQYYQAEAYKFIVEKSRVNVDSNGIVLWNLRDGFPVFASSLVDYYGNKKAAFYAVATSYSALQCVISDGKAFIVNDAGSKGECVVLIEDALGKTIFSKSLFITGAAVEAVGGIDAKSDDFLFITLKFDGETITNYKCNYVDKIDYLRYDALYEKIKRFTRRK